MLASEFNNDFVYIDSYFSCANEPTQSENGMCTNRIVENKKFPSSRVYKQVELSLDNKLHVNYKFILNNYQYNYDINGKVETDYPITYYMGIIEDNLDSLTLNVTKEKVYSDNPKKITGKTFMKNLEKAISKQ